MSGPSVLLTNFPLPVMPPIGRELKIGWASVYRILEAATAKMSTGHEMERLERSFSFLRPLPREQTRTDAAGNPEIQGAVMPCFAALH